MQSKKLHEDEPSQPKPKIENLDQLRYQPILIDSEEVDLFLQIGRKVIDVGRKSLMRLTKIEANLRELRLIYVAGAGESPDDADPDSDMEIGLEDLWYTK